MRRLILFVPLLALAAFGGYYYSWRTAFTARLETSARDPLAIYGYRDGHHDADADLARGVRRLFIYGTLAAEQAEYNGLLDRIYGVQVKFITPSPTPEVKRYAAAYNAVMERDLAATFGPDTLAHTRALAQERHALNVRVAAYVSPL